MATLTSPAGTFWDRSAAQSVTATGNVGTYQLTLNHSLGASPDFIAVNMLSLGLLAGGSASLGIVPVLGALRGNSSINTIQVLVNSFAASSIPTFAYEAYSAVIHSYVR